MNKAHLPLNIEAYGCSSSAGPSVEDFWRGLCEGRDHSTLDSVGQRVCVWKIRGESASADLNRELLRAWNQVALKTGPIDSSRLGVILSSTKGITDDFVWSGEPESKDPLTPVLENFLNSAELSPQLKIVVSNACASALSALFLAKQWVNAGRVDRVLILSTDVIGPFVSRGFAALRALTKERARPFDRNRQGFYLGDAACAILVSINGKGVILDDVAIDAEGFAVTRPSAGGESLMRACKKLRGEKPDLILAHGTATIANDETEDRVFSEVFPSALITSTKWSVGHTLGASGALDVIAACEIFRQKIAFTLGNTTEADPSFKSKYLIKGEPLRFNGKNILISSLGFGGIHAAAILRSNS